ncbi:MAG: hypothetical protein M1450_00595 [Patescibacteria group bacterium]|nr:hypothetical protein [Patescibacteria group bacterium]
MKLEELEKKAKELALKDKWDKEVAIVNKQIIAFGNSQYLTNAYNRLAKCYFRNGFLFEAIKISSESIRVNSENLIAQHFIANCHNILTLWIFQ